MAHLYIPLDGVPIVPAPPGPDFIAADGYVVFALSVRQFYAYNQALGIWQPAGGGIVVADTDSIDLTDTAGTLTADVLISTDSAPVGSVKATITVQPAPNPGLLAVVAESDIQALFSATDTDSVDLSYTAGAYSADLKLSSNAADTGYQLVDLNVETGAGAGLRAQIADSAIQNLISVSDSNSIDFSYTTGAISGDVRLSNNAADVGYKVVPIDIQTTGTVGLRAQIANSDIQGALTVTDTDAVNLTYTGGDISANLVFSADPPDLNYEIVELSVRTPATSPGLHAQISHSNIRDAISVSDTNSLDLTYGAGIINGDVRLSTDAADTGFTIVGLSIQAGLSKGLRAQVQNTAIQGLFSASAPIVYSAGAFSFDVNTTALTAYLPKTGGTVTGAIISVIPYSNLTVVTGMLQPSATAFGNVSHLTSTTLTFDATKGECFKFSINAEGHAGLEVCAYYKHGLLTILTDQENKYQEADSGSGFYIAKGNNTGVITIKNRLGGTTKVLINIKEGVLLSATAWA
jgi:fructose-specific phosphotransferase system component IIB